MANKSSKIFVRSILDLGDYNDDEVNNEPSLTDPSCDEPIERLVGRMLRGEIVGSTAPQYDTDSSVDPEEVFANQSRIAKRGFDLSDAANIVHRANKAVKGLRKAKDKPAVSPATPPPAAPQSPTEAQIGPTEPV